MVPLAYHARLPFSIKSPPVALVFSQRCVGMVQTPQYKKPHDILDRIKFNGMQGTNQAMKSKLQCLRYPIIFSLDGYRSPLHAAAFNDQVECLQLLLSRGGNVDTVDQSGRTPLIMAADNGHAGAVGKLAQVREQEQETAYSEKIWLIY